MCGSWCGCTDLSGGCSLPLFQFCCCNQVEPDDDHKNEQMQVLVCESEVSVPGWLVF